MMGEKAGKKTRQRYHKMKDGEVMETELPSIVRFACCDCNLVHNIAFAIEENGKLGIAVERNQKETKRRRRTVKSEDPDLCLWPSRQCKWK